MLVCIRCFAVLCAHETVGHACINYIMAQHDPCMHIYIYIYIPRHTESEEDKYTVGQLRQRHTEATERENETEPERALCLNNVEGRAL